MSLFSTRRIDNSSLAKGSVTATPNTLAQRDSTGATAFNKVSLAATPTLATDAVNKGYIDTTTSPVVSILKYGAVGDGVTNCTTAIQAAVNATTNGIVIIPPGIFVINNMITVSNIVTIRGQGGSLVYTGSAGSEAAIKYVFQFTTDYVKFEQVKLSTSVAYIGAVEIKTGQCLVKDCQFDQFTMGVVASGTGGGFTNNRVIDNRITNVVGVASESRGDGVLLFTPNSEISGNYVTCKAGTDGRCGVCFDIQAPNSLITNNIISGSFRRSIHVELSDNVVVSNNTVSGATMWSIIAQANNMVVSNNDVTVPEVYPGPLAGNPIAGIYSNMAPLNCQNIVFTNNIIRGTVAKTATDVYGMCLFANKCTMSGNQLVGVASSMTTGFYLVGGVGHTVSSCSIAASVCTSAGISAYLSNEARITSCYVEKTGGSGIQIYNAQKCTVSSCSVKNCGTYGIGTLTSSQLTVTGNQCWDDQGTKTQQYGLKLDSGIDIVVVGNQFQGNLTGSLSSLNSPVAYYRGNMGIADNIPVPALTGDVTSNGTTNATAIASATVTGKLLTGYASATGAVSAADSILTAIGKLNGNTPTSVAGDVTGALNATAIASTTVTGKLLTGYSSSAGTVAATDSILTAVGKLNGNISAYPAANTLVSLTGAQALTNKTITLQSLGGTGSQLNHYEEYDNPTVTFTCGSYTTDPCYIRLTRIGRLVNLICLDGFSSSGGTPGSAFISDLTIPPQFQIEDNIAPGITGISNNGVSGIGIVSLQTDGKIYIWGGRSGIPFTGSGTIEFEPFTITYGI